MSEGLTAMSAGLGRFKVRGFANREEGGVLVETILWIPFMISVTIMILDMAFVLMNYARAQRIMHDGNRALAVGAYSDCTAAQAAVQTNLRVVIPDAVVACSSAGTGASLGATMNSSNMDLTGASGIVGGFTMRAGSTQTYEYVPGV